MKEIIYRQGGNSEIKIEDIKIGEHKLEIQSENSGNVLWLDNNIIVTIARLAGAPKDKGAGIIIHKKIGQKVMKYDKLLTIFSEKKNKIHNVEKMLTEIKPFHVGHRQEMIIHTFLDIPEPKKKVYLGTLEVTLASIIVFYPVIKLNIFLTSFIPLCYSIQYLILSTRSMMKAYDLSVQNSEKN